MILYPLKFYPILKERIWGGSKLKKVLGKPIPSKNTGESWELSAVPGDISIVSNGEFRGTSLQELLDTYKDELLGKAVFSRFGNEFPVLIKFIDAKMDLSIQLHPGDELAKARHNSLGKTEMWYIMDADRDANLIVGFNRDVEKETYENHLREGRLTELLHYEKVQEGDTFFIGNGKIHAIGAGILLAEIQQTSDITYRVYDFNRKDKQGKLRELHTDLALDAIDYSRKDDFKVAYSKNVNKANTMVQCPYFKTDFLHVDRDLTVNVDDRDSFTILVCVSGSAEILNDSGTASVARGETLLLPANSTFIGIQTKGAKFLEVTL